MVSRSDQRVCIPRQAMYDYRDDGGDDIPDVLHDNDADRKGKLREVMEKTKEELSGATYFSTKSGS